MLRMKLTMPIRLINTNFNKNKLQFSIHYSTKRLKIAIHQKYGDPGITEHKTLFSNKREVDCVSLSPQPLSQVPAGQLGSY